MPEPSSSPLPLSFGDEGKCKPPPRTCENEAYPTGRRSAFCGDTTLPLLASRWRIANFLELRYGEVHEDRNAVERYRNCTGMFRYQLRIIIILGSSPAFRNGKTDRLWYSEPVRN